MGGMSTRSIVPDKVPVTIGTKLNFNGCGDGNVIRDGVRLALDRWPVATSFDLKGT